jgi:predicted ATPase
MIKRLSISNYRSLGENVTMELGRFTCLVGPNGSGKSNVLDALRLLSDIWSMGLAGAITQRHQEIGPVRRLSGGHPREVSIRLDLEIDAGCSASYSFDLRGEGPYEFRVGSETAQVWKDEEKYQFRIENGRWINGPPGLTPVLDDKNLGLSAIGGDSRFQPLVQALQQIAIYSIYPDSLRTPHRYSPVKPLDRHGSNWVSILKDQPEDTWKPELVSALNRLTGDIEDMRISEAAGYLVVQFFRANKRQWFDAAQESDGTLRIAGILTALLQEPPVQVLAIEEPELTVHPGAIPLLYDFLKQASRRSQVLVTTHSPELLDLMSAEDVRVVVRRQEGTTVAPMAADQRRAVRNGLMTLGEVLRTEGLQQDLPFAVAE